MSPSSALCGLWAGCSEDECQTCPQAPQNEPSESCKEVAVPCKCAGNSRSEAYQAWRSRHFCAVATENTPECGR